MKQGTEWVYVRVSLALVGEMKSWSRAVQVKLEEDYNGDIELVSRDVSGLSLRELAKAL
jgi:hypothetical protein